MSLNITIDSKRQEAASMLGFSIFFCVCVFACEPFDCFYSCAALAGPRRPSVISTLQLCFSSRWTKPFRLLLFLLTAQFSVTVILWDTAAGARIINYMSCFTDYMCLVKPLICTITTTLFSVVWGLLFQLIFD